MLIIFISTVNTGTSDDSHLKGSLHALQLKQEFDMFTTYRVSIKSGDSIIVCEVRFVLLLVVKKSVQ